MALTHLTNSSVFLLSVKLFHLCESCSRDVLGKITLIRYPLGTGDRKWVPSYCSSMYMYEQISECVHRRMNISIVADSERKQVVDQ